MRPKAERRVLPVANELCAQMRSVGPRRKREAHTARPASPRTAVSEARLMLVTCSGAGSGLPDTFRRVSHGSC
jgi:hypothetical protein